MLWAGTLLATFALAIRATGGYDWYGGWSRQSIYDASAFGLVGIVVLGGLLLASTTAAVRRAGGATVIVAGVALGGTGATAFRRWRTSGGFVGPAKNQSDLRLMAAVLAVAGAAVAVVGLVHVWSALNKQPSRLLVAAGLASVMAIGVPLTMGYNSGSTGTTSYGAHALIYSLAWAVGVGICVVGDRVAAVSAAAAVLVHMALVAADSRPMIWAPRRMRAIGLASVILLVAWLLRRQPANADGSAADSVDAIWSRPVDTHFSA